MSAQRTCQGCDKDFIQTFGGRPRKKCYDCVPARLNQNGDTPRTKRGKQHGGVAQKTQSKHNQPDTAGKHADTQVERASSESSQRHCPYCGSYPAGNANTNESYLFCNPNHRARFAEKVAKAQAEGKARHDSNGKLPSMLAGHKPPRQRPLERVRELREAERRPSRKKAMA
jgi:hypothetical protein